MVRGDDYCIFTRKDLLIRRYQYNVMFSCCNIFLSDSRFLENGNSKRVQEFHHISSLGLLYWPELFAFHGNAFKRVLIQKAYLVSNHLSDGKFLGVILSL